MKLMVRALAQSIAASPRPPPRVSTGCTELDGGQRRFTEPAMDLCNSIYMANPRPGQIPQFQRLNRLLHLYGFLFSTRLQRSGTNACLSVMADPVRPPMTVSPSSVSSASNLLGRLPLSTLLFCWCSACFYCLL